MIYIRRDLFDSLAVGHWPWADHPLLLAGWKMRYAWSFPRSALPHSLWSLDRTKNADITRIIRLIVIEEVPHMTLVCNILNLLGQTPRIDDQQFAQTYPGPLPGGVETDLIVHLRPLSMEQLQVFLELEQPEEILNFLSHTAMMAAGAPLTIGQFCKMLRQQIGSLKDIDFGVRNQVDPNTIDNAMLVTDVRSAQAAINLIVLQGEGTPSSPLEAPGSLAHYYKFKQIEKGAQLSPNPAAGPDTPPDQRYIYNGRPVKFEPAGVFSAPADPKAANYPANSMARLAMDQFNRDYRNLKLVQSGFSGNSAALSTAVRPMMLNLGAEGHLGAEGRKVIMTLPADGGRLGPSFEYMDGP